MYLKRVIQQNRLFLIRVVVLSIANSILFSSIPLLISLTIRGEGLFFFEPGQVWLPFLVLIAGSFLCRTMFQRYMIRFTNTVLFDLEVALLRQLNGSDLESFNRLDKPAVYTVFTDIRTVSQLPRFFIDSINYAVVIIVSFSYLAWMSAPAALILAGCAALLAAYYSLRNRSVARMLGESRTLENHFYRYLNDLLTGFKGMKLNRVRRSNLFEQFIRPNRSKACELEVGASTVYMNNELLGNYSWFLILGIIVFVLPQFSLLSGGESLSFIVIILYLMAPVSALINALPFYTRISIAMKRIGRFVENNKRLAPPEPAQADSTTVVNMKQIRFEGVGYQYPVQADRQPFILQNLSLDIRQGEVIFVTGENGSGKSTFMLLLTGLLHPQSGRILVNGVPLQPEESESYSNRFSAIFSDSILYSENYDGFELHAGNPVLMDHFSLMKLRTDIITRESTIRTELSKGQQKRLALIYSLMEEREVLVLDEWAAEQDPHFRAYFYKTVLPQLKQLGKTVIAVTHDDKYFHLADRTLRFHQGNASIESNSAESMANHAQRIWF
jgi:cyclic peptide transporter